MALKKKISNSSELKVWALMRVTLGATFMWAFFDKLIGLGFATCRDEVSGQISVMCSKSWIEGGSPTLGFLKFASKGPFAELYQSLAGNPLIDFLFMSGLLLIGGALILGIGMKIATVTGSVLVIMMYSAVLPPANNPILDEHIVYLLILIGLFSTNNRQVWGLGKWWAKQPLVKKYPLLQ